MDLLSRSLRLFDTAVLGLAVSVALTVIAGTALALMGSYSPWIALALLVIATPVTSFAVSRMATVDHPHDPKAVVGPGIAVALALAVLTAVNASSASNHLLTDRDQGVYNTAALFLSHEGDLEPDVLEGPFRSDEGLILEAPGYWRLAGDPAHTSIQFLTGLPVLLSLGNIYSLRGMFAVPAILTALAMWTLYAVGSRFTKPWAAATCVVALACSMPLVFVARDSLTEPLLIWLLLAGVWLLSSLGKKPDLLLAATTGLVLGATAVVRIEAPFYLAGLAVALATMSRTIPVRRQRYVVFGSVLAGSSLGMIVGQLNLAASPVYRVAHSYERNVSLRVLAAGLIASVIVLLLGERPADKARALGRRIAPVAFLAAPIVLFAIVWIRPRFELRRSPGVSSSAIEYYQLLEGLPLDGNRTYHEMTGQWVVWYIGVIAVVLAGVGLGVLAFRFLAGRAGWLEFGCVLLLAPGAIAALLHPAITPDQIWGSRRLVISVFPLLALAAALALSRLGELRFKAAPAFATIMALGVIAHPLWTQRDVWKATYAGGLASAVDGVCEIIGPDSALVVLAETDYQLHMPPAFRSRCEVPVVAATLDLGPQRLTELARVAEDEGTTLYLVTRTEQAAQWAHRDSTEVGRTAAVNDHLLEFTLESRPDGYISHNWVFIVSRIPT